jgi:YVTN family beta-propeller protein
MRNWVRTTKIAVIALVAVAGCSPTKAGEPLATAGTIPLEGVAGRIDHMAVDVAGKRLFVAALGNGSVEVIDLAARKRTGTIRDLREPQGVAYVPELDRIVVASGGDGTVRFYDAKGLKPIQTVRLGDDADNVRYDAPAKRVYVGYGDGALAALDAQTGQKLADIKLPGHPESFQLQAKGDRIFVNVPSARQVAVIDRRKAAVVANWPLKDVRANFPMALDEAGRRLIIACRSPARLVVLDTDSGTVVACEECVGDADDVFLDAAAERVYVSGGEGMIDVFRLASAGRDGLASSPVLQRLSRTTTAAGARTCFLAAELKALYLAVPARLLHPAELRVYAIP